MKKKMLIIEDNTFMTALLGNLFSTDFEIVSKENGIDALMYMNEVALPHIIISDIKMPEMDGIEFLENIRGSLFFKNIPVIILSGVEQSSDRIKCLQLGANDFIVKPFNPKELKLRIERALSQQANR